MTEQLQQQNNKRCCSVRRQLQEEFPPRATEDECRRFASCCCGGGAIPSEKCNNSSSNLRSGHNPPPPTEATSATQRRLLEEYLVWKTEFGTFFQSNDDNTEEEVPPRNVDSSNDAQVWKAAFQRAYSHHNNQQQHHYSKGQSDVTDSSSKTTTTTTSTKSNRKSGSSDEEGGGDENEEDEEEQVEVVVLTGTANKLMSNLSIRSSSLPQSSASSSASASSTSRRVGMVNTTDHPTAMTTKGRRFGRRCHSNNSNKQKSNAPSQQQNQQGNADVCPNQQILFFPSSSPQVKSNGKDGSKSSNGGGTGSSLGSPPLTCISGCPILYAIPARMDLHRVPKEVYGNAFAMYMLHQQQQQEQNEKNIGSGGEEEIHGTSTRGVLPRPPLTIVLDVRAGTGWCNTPITSMLPLVRHVLRQLQNLFPGRLHRCIVFPVPAVAVLLWNAVVRPFLDRAVSDRVVLVAGPGTGSHAPLPYERMSAFVDVPELERLAAIRTAAMIPNSNNNTDKNK
jgi:CRAL/TRIO domain